jgi:membrane associated rhomboid family serine protease
VTLEQPVEVFRSFWRAACEERGFVLHAVGVESQVVWLGRAWALLVEAGDQTAAVAHLEHYERENPPRQRPAAPEPLHGAAWLGSVVYAAVVLVVGHLAGEFTFGADWLDAGALRAGPTRAGEWWRAVTALTLHLDVGHLLANLGFGAVFGLLAGQLLGPGVAWASVLLAASAANLLNAFLQPQSHSSAGASTAVFATLGLLAAYAWRLRRDPGDRWAYRWAPLVAGIVLLGFTGSGGERTDVLAHLTGFAMGALAGIAHAAWRVRQGTIVQLLCGLLALVALAAAWSVALATAQERASGRARPLPEWSGPVILGDVDHHLSSRAPGLNVTDRVGHLAEPVAPVDDWRQLAGLHEIAQDEEVRRIRLRQQDDELLVDEHGQQRRPDESEQRPEPGIVLGASDEDVDALGRQGPPDVTQRVIAHRVEDHVVAPPAAREVLARVVDDVIRAE